LGIRNGNGGLAEGGVSGRTRRITNKLRGGAKIMNLLRGERREETELRKEASVGTGEG